MKSFTIIRVGNYYYLTNGYKAIRLVANDLYAAIDDAKAKVRQWKVLATHDTQIDEIGQNVPSLVYRISFQGVY